LGETDSATQELSAYLGGGGTGINLFEDTDGPEALASGSYHEDAATGDWVGSVERYLIGKMTETDLLASMGAISDSKKARRGTCAAWFYIGTKHLLDGDKKTAAEDFQKCRSTDEKNFGEYQLAQVDLQELGNPGTAGAP
jgi:lipoprotein NlpI